jgi:hypothetical protein
VYNVWMPETGGIKRSRDVSCNILGGRFFAP